MSEGIDKLVSALVEAQGYARALFKEAQNKHHGYAYASAEQVIDEARRALSQAGLAFLQVEDHLDRSKAKGDVIGEARCLYKLVHKSGQEMPISGSMPVIISKGRPDDKAYCAALTTGLAYTLRSLLLIPRDDNAAAIDQRDDRGYDPAEAQRQLAERFAADMARAADEPELEELRAAAKRELDPVPPQVIEAYKARVQQLRPQAQQQAQRQQQAPPMQHHTVGAEPYEPPAQQPQGTRGASTDDWAMLEREALESIAKATNRGVLDEAKSYFAMAPERHRSRVFAAAFKRLFELIEDASELARYATEVRDAGLGDDDLRDVREAYAARREALTRRAA